MRSSYRLHQCQCCRRLPLHCHQCLSAVGCCQMDSYHSGPRPHLCQSQTAEGCTPMGSCPMPNTHIDACIHTHRGCEYSPVLSHGILKVTPCLRHSLTLSSMMSSLSSSGSQASPCPSLSRSSCPEFGILGQLSCSQSQLSLMKLHPNRTLPANQITFFFLYF